MKKTMYLSLALLLLTASGGWAYEFNNTTQVQEWNGSGPYYGGPWTDLIGESTVYQTMGGNFERQHTFHLYQLEPGQRW